MSLLDYYTGQQTWANYVSNRDLGERFESSLTKTGDRLAIQLNRDEQDTAIREGLGSLENSLTSGFDDLRYELQDVSAGIDRLNADFHILMGDVVWRLERQTETLKAILRVIQTPLDTASKELRARADYAYQNGWYDKALDDYLESEKKNYQDFAVHRSIGNIYLYHLVDLPRAVRYFEQAAKYARPCAIRQAAEAEYFAGVASGLRQDFISGFKHMREATSLNAEFYDAYYSSAIFAILQDKSDLVSENLERAIQGDARYFERCRHETCFDKIRVQIDALLARLLAEGQAEANARIDELQKTLKELRQKGATDAVLEKYAAQLTEIEGIRGLGHYSALRVAAPRAFEAMVASLEDGVKSLDGTAEHIANEMNGRRYGLNRDAEQIERQAEQVVRQIQEAMKEKKDKLFETHERVWQLIIGSLLLFAGFPPFSNVFTALLSIIALVVGGILVLMGGFDLVQVVKVNSRIDSLKWQASAARDQFQVARDQLKDGRDDFLRRLEGELAEVHKNRNALSNMLALASARRPAKLLPAKENRSKGSSENEGIWYTVILADFGPNKINTIKAVREVTSLGLKEAKDLVDGVPNAIKASADKDEAEAIRKKFADIGVTVKLEPVS
jgi:large subunit ribosomal protein L7/L12